MTRSAGTSGLMPRRIAAHLFDGVAHGGEIHNGGNAGEVLQNHAGRHEGQLLRLAGPGCAPGCQRASASTSASQTRPGARSALRRAFSTRMRRVKGSCSIGVVCWPARASGGRWRRCRRRWRGWRARRSGWETGTSWRSAPLQWRWGKCGTPQYSAETALPPTRSRHGSRRARGMAPSQVLQEV